MQLSSSPDSYIMDFLGHPDYFKNVTARTLFGLTDPGMMPIFQSNALLLWKCLRHLGYGTMCLTCQRAPDS